MKTLIFGISGFVGNYLAQEFLNAGYQLYGSDIQETDNLPKEVKFKRLNLLERESVFQLISDVKADIIINLAAVSSVGESWNIPQTTVMINVVGTLNILEAARKQSPIPKILLVGSSEQYKAFDKPISEQMPLNYNNPYGISKVTQEQFAKLYREQYNLNVYCVRPFNHTGIGQKETFVLPSFCKQAAEIERSGQPGVIHTGNLSIIRDFSHVKDIVRAYRMILERGDPNKIYNVGSGITYSLEELLQYIISLCKQKIEIVVDSERIRPVEIPAICCDYSLLEHDLGWRPEYTVLDALKEMFMLYLA